MASRMVNIFQSRFNCVTRVDARLDVFLGKSRQFSTFDNIIVVCFFFHFPSLLYVTSRKLGRL